MDANDDTIAHVFIAEASSNEWLQSLVSSALRDIVADFSASPSASSAPQCLLADAGDYLIRCVAILSRLSGRLADGDHVKIYARQGIDVMDDRDGFSDLDFLGYMDSKHKSLR